jgi:hypothetical protein
MGEPSALSDQVDRGREMVSGTEAGQPAKESKAVCRSNGGQDPAHHAPGLQTRAEARVCAATARRQSHELGEPANDQRLHGGPHDAEAGIRDFAQHSRAEAHAHPERCGYGVASVGVAGPDVDGSRLRRSGDVCEAGVCVGKVQGAEVEGIEGPGSHAPSLGRVSSRVARHDAFRQGYRLRVPERPSRGQEAVVCVDHGAEVPATGGSESRRDQGRAEGAIRLSQFPAFTGDGAGEAESGCEDGTGDAASRGLRDDHAALYAQFDMESMRDAQGKFLEQLLGDRIHLLTEKVQ